MGDLLQVRGEALEGSSSVLFVAIRLRLAAEEQGDGALVVEDEGAADVGELGVGAGRHLLVAGEQGAREGVVLLAGD